ncbi:MAG: RNA polymerase sigma factor [Deltaproteobacteria bacterium]|nr:RNA polymerase sigma factor [Deltaproteobacteria bacterium]
MLVSHRRFSYCAKLLDRIREVIHAHWRRVFQFAYRLLVDRDSATSIVEETFLRAYLGRSKMPPPQRVEQWLFRITAHVVASRYGQSADVSFDLLDETLRSDATRTDVVRSLTGNERNFLLWELKQGCITAVVNCLPLGEREAFVLLQIMGLAEEDAADTLGISIGALKTRLLRARKKVADYLSPRCEHVDPRNPCRCPSRLGIAISKGFLPSPSSSAVKLRPEFPQYFQSTETARRRDAMVMIQSLPEPDLPDDFPDRLFRLLDTGAWDRVKNA